MSTTDLDLRSKILLSIQRALLSCITSEMRFISVEWSRYRIHLHVYVDGVMREDTYEDFDRSFLGRRSSECAPTATCA